MPQSNAYPLINTTFAETFGLGVVTPRQSPPKAISTQRVWVANPNIDRRNYPGVDWNDIEALEKDSRFGSFVSVSTLGNADNVSTALDSGADSVNAIFGLPAHLVAGASLGVFALLLL